jgi:hypothetical protein
MRPIGDPARSRTSIKNPAQGGSKSNSNAQDGSWTAPTRLGHSDSSILRQLSENLSVAADTRPSSSSGVLLVPIP